MGRPGLGQAEVIGPPDDIQTVKVGGQAALVLRGEIVIIKRFFGTMQGWSDRAQTPADTENLLSQIIEAS